MVCALPSRKSALFFFWFVYKSTLSFPRGTSYVRYSSSFFFSFFGFFCRVSQTCTNPQNMSKIYLQTLAHTYMGHSSVHVLDMAIYLFTFGARTTSAMRSNVQVVRSKEARKGTEAVRKIMSRRLYARRWLERCPGDTTFSNSRLRQHGSLRPRLTFGIFSVRHPSGTLNGLG